MEKWEKQLNQVNVPDPIVSSHRDGLRKKLQSGRIPRGQGVRNTVTFTLAALFLISGLTAVYPSWAKDFYQNIIISNITLHTKDGGEIKLRTIRAECEPGSAVCDSLMTGIAGMEAVEGVICKKIIAFDSEEDRAEQMMRIDAEISEFTSQIVNGGEQTITIESVDGGSKWIVNGEEVTAEETVVPINSAADIADEAVRGIIPSAADEASMTASSFELLQNYPNPFNPTTTIPFNLKQSGPVTLKVYNVTGQEVATLADGIMAAGNHSLTFDGAGLPTGAYIYMLTANGSKQVKTMMLTK